MPFKAIIAPTAKGTMEIKNLGANSTTRPAMASSMPSVRVITLLFWLRPLYQE